MKQENKIEFLDKETSANYDAISPITGNTCVLIEADEMTNQESRICMESGYTTNDVWQIDSEQVSKYEQHISQLMVDTKYVDNELGQVWYLASMTTSTVVLYPVGTNKDDYHFEISKVVTIDGDERLKYPIPGKSDEYFTSRLDVENAVIFEKNNFAQAVDKFYSTLTEMTNEN